MRAHTTTTHTTTTHTTTTHTRRRHMGELVLLVVVFRFEGFQPEESNAANGSRLSSINA
jgi:hypothetical protein